MAETPSFRTGYDYDELKQKTASLVWDVATLSWVKMTQPAVPTGVITATPAAPATAAVSDVNATVVAANVNRQGLIVTNVGSENVFFGCGASALVNGGIVLTPGGTWVMDPYTFTTLSIDAVCAAGKGSTLAIQEYSS